jgi:hypothetical protein
VKVWLLWLGTASIAFGLALVAVGLAWPWIERLGLGHLPGDLHIEREGWSFYFPITTCIVVSLVASLIVWLIKR